MESLEHQLKRKQMIRENEELFVRLSLIHAVGSPATKELMDEGYITNDNSDTNKAYEFKAHFYNENKEAVYNAVKSYGNTKERQLVKEACGFKDYFAFELMAEQLVLDERLEKNSYGIYYAK